MVINRGCCSCVVDDDDESDNDDDNVNIVKDYDDDDVDDDNDLVLNVCVWPPMNPFINRRWDGALWLAGCTFRGIDQVDLHLQKGLPVLMMKVMTWWWVMVTFCLQ